MNSKKGVYNIRIIVYDKNGKSKKLDEQKLLKEATYTLVDKLIKKDDTAVVEIMETSSEEGLINALGYAIRRKK